MEEQPKWEVSVPGGIIRFGESKPNNTELVLYHNAQTRVAQAEADLAGAQIARAKTVAELRKWKKIRQKYLQIRDLHWRLVGVYLKKHRDATGGVFVGKGDSK
jgi:hypothetical protein